jgi:hypothetical protein
MLDAEFRIDRGEFGCEHFQRVAAFSVGQARAAMSAV